MHGGALRAKEVVGAKWASITRVDNLTLWWTMQCCLFICVQYIYTDGEQPDAVVDNAILKIVYILKQAPENGH